MSSLAYTFSDSATMLRRNLKHMIRYPSVTLMLIAVPIVFLLLFVYVLGGTLGAGLGGIEGGRGEYLEYVVPGILMMGIAGSAQGTAISVAMDMTTGIIARFRTMAITRASVLTGHVVGSVLQTLIGVVAVLAVAMAIGFRPDSSPLDFLALIGVLTLIALALTWVSTALGMVSRTVEGASNLPMPLMLLPFLGSGFVPTDSMPAGLRWFADYQPFTPFIETIRGLLLGTPIGSSAIQTVAWCVGLSVVCYVWSLRLYNRDPNR